MSRRGFTTDNIRLIQESFKLIYGSGLNNSLAVEKIESELEMIPELVSITEFIKASKRGIIGA